MSDRVVVGRVVTGVFVAGVVVYLLFYANSHRAPDVELYSRALYFAVAAMGLNLLTGYNGQVSIGHGAFFGIGAFTSARLVTAWGWTYLETVPVAALLAMVVGLLVGFPALRVKGLYLALVTLGLAVLFPDLIAKFIDTRGQNLINVQNRYRNAPDWWPESLSARHEWAFYFTFLVAFVLVVAMFFIVRSRFGRSLIAVRDHEPAATTVGINPASAKLGAFAISALYAGLAGSLSVLVLGTAEANRATTFTVSIQFLVAVVIGGTATVAGPVVGGFLVVLTEDFIAHLVEAPNLYSWIPFRTQLEDFFEGKTELSPALFGIALVLLMYVLPDGLVGGAKRVYSRLWDLLSGRRVHRPVSTPIPN
jgi:branched-chain amino acid transport system permease protein